MTRPGRVSAIGLILALGACAHVPVPDVPGVAFPGSGSGPTREMVEDRVWLAQDADQAPGSFLVFVSDGTLVMDSCHETWRMAPWRWVEDAVVVWEEDAVTVRAEVVIVGRDELVLLVEPGKLDLTRTYAAAKAPQLCGGG